MGVTTDDDGLLPTLNKTRDAGNNNGLTEDGASENVSDGAVRRQPHCRQSVPTFHDIGMCMLTLLELELFHTLLIGGDGGALDGDRVLLGGLGRVDGDLVVGLVTVLQSLYSMRCCTDMQAIGHQRGTHKIVVLEVNVEVAGEGSTDESQTIRSSVGLTGV